MKHKRSKIPNKVKKVSKGRAGGNSDGPARPVRPGSALARCKKIDDAARILWVVRETRPDLPAEKAMEVVGFSHEECGNDRLQRRVLRRKQVITEEEDERQIASSLKSFAYPPMIIEPSEESLMSMVTTPSALETIVTTRSATISKDDEEATMMMS